MDKKFVRKLKEEIKKMKKEIGKKNIFLKLTWLYLPSKH